MRKKPEEKGAKDLSALGKRFAAFRPGKEVLEDVQAVPTRFVQFDHATRVGGFPTKRASVIHGPSNEGKTAFILGIGGSFIEHGHFFHLVDAERTTTVTWVTELLGKLVAQSDRFHATRPRTYEECVDEVRDYHRAVAAARAAGEVPATATAITVVDSLRKLVPEDIMKKILKEGASGEKGSIDGMGGRAAQIRAAMNSAWMDELVPLLDECGTAFAAIARESEDPNADMWAKKFGNDYKIGGGKAVIYDASLVCRIQRDGWTTIEKNGEKTIVGERHKVTIRKTKVGGKEGRASIAYYHTSNGVLTPAGFDRARDVVELALKLGVLTQAGAYIRWPSMDSGSGWRSREAAIAALQGVAELDLIEAECRAQFDTLAPEEEPEPPAKVEF